VAPESHRGSAGNAPSVPLAKGADDEDWQEAEHEARGMRRVPGAGSPDITSQGLLARGKSMDTISVSLCYSFF
jgi:hypothetical protein